MTIEKETIDKIRSWVRWILLGLIVLLLLGFFLHIFVLDSIPPSDAALRVSYVPIPASKNGFTVMRQAAAALKQKSNDFTQLYDRLYKDEWDAAYMSKLVKENDQTIILFLQALDYERIQTPELVRDKNNEVSQPYLSSLRRLAQLTSVKAQLLFDQGKEQEAFDLLRNVIQLGHRLQAADGDEIQYLVGGGIKVGALERLEAMLKKTTLPAEYLTGLARKLGSYRMNTKAVINTLKVDYHLQCQLVDNWAAGKGLDLGVAGKAAVKCGIRFYKPNRTKRLYAELYRALIQNVGKPLTAAKPLPPPPKRDLWSLFKQGNIGGDMSFFMFRWIMVKCQLTRCAHSNRMAVGQLMLALKAYKLKNGELPKELKALVPDYLPELPKDAFDGKPLRYSYENKVIYTVGEDLKDDGGMTHEEIEKVKKRRIWDEADPSFPIKF